MKAKKKPGRKPLSLTSKSVNVSIVMPEDLRDGFRRYKLSSELRAWLAGRIAEIKAS